MLYRLRLRLIHFAFTKKRCATFQIKLFALLSNTFSANTLKKALVNVLFFRIAI